MSWARINQVKGRKFHGCWSRLRRLAQKLPRLPTTPFAKLWIPLFLILCVLCNVMIQKPWFGNTTVELFFNAVAVLREDDMCSVQIVTFPTSPKPQPGGRDRPPPPPTVSVELAARGLRPAGSVAIQERT